MHRRLSLTLALCLTFAAPHGMLNAQSLTDSENEQATKLQNQLKTRGIGIAPTGTGSAATAGSAAPAQASETVALRTETGSTVEYIAFDKEDQVFSNIVFDFDSSALREDQKPAVNQICNAVKGASVESLLIVGHTDSTGSQAYNERLSLLRAQEVKRYMVSACGIGADKLEAVGMGARVLYDRDNPKADVNRRVEFQALS